MWQSFLAIVPLFLLIFLGYLGKRTLFDVRMLPGLNQFVYYFAVPALLFKAASAEPVTRLLNGPALSAFLLGAGLTAALCWVVGRYLFGQHQPRQLIIRGLNGVFANYAYMGIPLAFAVLGESAHVATVSIILAGNIVLIGGSQLLLELTSHQRIDKRALWLIIDRSLLRNPIVLATLIGLWVSANQLALPTPLVTLLDMLAPAAVPVALFCLGASLQITGTSLSRGELGWMLLLKLFFHPLLTLLAFWLVGVDGVWMQTAVLLTALPTGALAHVVALKYDVFEKETSQIIVTSTLVSLISVSFWMSFV